MIEQIVRNLKDHDEFLLSPVADKAFENIEAETIILKQDLHRHHREISGTGKTKGERYKHPSLEFLKKDNIS